MISRCIGSASKLEELLNFKKVFNDKSMQSDKSHEKDRENCMKFIFQQHRSKLYVDHDFTIHSNDKDPFSEKLE